MIEFIAQIIVFLVYIIGGLIFLAILVLPIIEVIQNKFFPHKIDFSKNDRAEHMKKVWLSCKTEEQERNCERWIARTAKPWPSDERDDIMEYIEEYKEVRSALKWRPIKKRKPEKELIYKVADQEKRIKELELKFEALAKYVRKNIAKAKGD